MHFDLDEAAPERISTQTCVIGAGAAGITVARRLLAAGQTVLLIESGGLDYEPATADLNAGENVGQEYYELDHARLRFFGGTTAIWGGRCAELDAIDFQPRYWVPHSGWPIGKADLAPYYVEARRALELPDTPDVDGPVAEAMGLPDFDRARIQPRLWSFDNRFNRFTFASCADLRNHPACTILTHATVREIVADPAGKSIGWLDVQGLSGRRIRIDAGDYVLAAGGIENARLLLASRSVRPRGLGNDHDQVGRYFMEHPHARGGRIVEGNSWAILNAFGRKHRIDGQDYAALVTPGETLQEQARLLNTSLTIAGRRSADVGESYAMRGYNRLKHDMEPTRLGRALWMRTKQASHLVLRHSEPARPWLLNKLGRLDVALVVRAEQAPNPASRVTLSDEVDAMGVPRVRLDWRTTALDVDSVEGLVCALGREMRRLGLGEVEPADWLGDPHRRWTTDPLISAHPIGGYHHIGTTRMSADPRHGVTDDRGRVHGIANLHVAGSSLFPTSGWANPTLTIVALALRTADAIAHRGVASPVTERELVDA